MLDALTIHAHRIVKLLTSILLPTIGLSLLSLNTQAFSAKDLEGDFTQGGMVYGQTTPGNTVKLNGTKVRTSPDGHFVFGFGRDAKLKHTLTVSNRDTKHTIPIALSKRDYKIQRIEGISKKIMQPSSANLKRISTEAKQVRLARRTDSNLLHFLDRITLPVDGPITGVYGSQRFFNGEAKRPHYGLDLAAPTGTPVVAPLPGKVTLTHSNMFYSGGTLIIDHGYGISSTFIHLSEVLVTVGQEVKSGDLIAKVGASGRATGPHLDWRINWFAVRLDPQLLLK